MSLTFQVAPHMAEPFMPATVLASVSELVSQTQIRPEKLHFFDEYSGSFQFDWEDFWDEKSRELQEVHADLQSDEIRILYEAPPKKPPKRVLLQSSVNEDDIPRIEPQNNGLVHTALEAYNYHHNLVIRPDDLWIAILAQFSLYVNRHSAEMRKFFVEHKEGKKKLVVSTAGDRYTVNWGELAESMTSEIRVWMHTFIHLVHSYNGG